MERGIEELYLLMVILEYGLIASYLSLYHYQSMDSSVSEIQNFSVFSV